YEETDDQIKAIEETKADMESTKIMDRLICGDVGYGKTEVAIRAAFKAVADNRQVVFLVPTTILAQQHFNTFTQRMRDYPVTVEMLSRFKTVAQQKDIIKRVASGQVDILIGTHRVLSKDLSFKRLGLLIVDEEQRFGVSHKEKLKQMKGDVDVLTLTATPIPRTLHMSLSGIRDMSVLDEPPVDRLPIQTFVLEHNDEIIREAINRELARNGQVYYVYNKVIGIDEIASRIAKLVPDANVAYAHGQMNERQLERIMLSFISGEIDVLVSTTIIETGLDISNVNTIIIDDADRLGLAQLYQLRGRVGRSNRTAYAFLMYKRDKMLKEVAEKRLSAIREFTELGSGFKIAMRDLEIRGAGNLLGAQQSGHMEAVGYDMYCKLLNEAVRKLKGLEETGEEFDTGIDLEIDAYIPSSYIKNEGQRLAMYKRIADIENSRELEDLEDELTDRFGDLPVCVENLLYIALTRHAGHEVYVTSITQKQAIVKLAMYPKAALDVAGIPKVISKYENRLKLMPGNPPSFEFKIVPPGKAEPAKKGAKTRGKGVLVCSQLMELFEEIKETCLKDG
ncbi:MAG: DEAD/DEAH box helicase, partial [Lachnospiraceae bacterium]|nr:DEAD/DEAH box helicase [Lachnospiraceae bacterium]